MAAERGCRRVRGGDAAVDAYLDPAKPFTNELALRKVIRGLTGRVLWYEQHMSRKNLEPLIEELNNFWFPAMEYPNPKGPCNACAHVTLLLGKTRHRWIVWGSY